jgi:hypothetical protein
MRVHKIVEHGLDDLSVTIAVPGIRHGQIGGRGLPRVARQPLVLPPQPGMAVGFLGLVASTVVGPSAL